MNSAALLKGSGVGALFCLVLMLAGCRTQLIDVGIVNRGPALQLLEFDYPSASFGLDNLAAGGAYHYRFAVKGSGPVALHFEDRAGHSYNATGPTVMEGQSGSLTVTIDPALRATWQQELAGPK